MEQRFGCGGEGAGCRAQPGGAGAALGRGERQAGAAGEGGGHPRCRVAGIGVGFGERRGRQLAAQFGEGPGHARCAGCALRAEAVAGSEAQQRAQLRRLRQRRAIGAGDAADPREPAIEQQFQSNVGGAPRRSAPQPGAAQFARCICRKHLEGGQGVKSRVHLQVVRNACGKRGVICAAQSQTGHGREIRKHCTEHEARICIAPRRKPCVTEEIHAAHGITPATLAGLKSGQLHIEICEGAAPQDALQIRRAVFMDEQGVSEAEEMDGLDGACVHFLAREKRGANAARAIGCARLRPLAGGSADAKVERVAVRAELRGRGLGGAIMAAVEAEAARRGWTRLLLHAQLRAARFYQGLGWRPSGGDFEEAGIPHRRMTKSLIS